MSLRGRIALLKAQAAVLEANVKRPLYAGRLVVNADELKAWAVKAGFATVLDDLHVTQAYSREPVAWPQFTQSGAAARQIVMLPSKNRKLVRFDKGAVVLELEPDLLVERWQEFMDGGASWDHDGYRPHITLSYNAPNIDLTKVEPFTGEIVLGPEYFETINTHKEKIEKAKRGGNANQPRWKAGTPLGGQWKGGGKGDPIGGQHAPYYGPTGEKVPAHLANLFGMHPDWEPAAPKEPLHAKAHTKNAVLHGATDDTGGKVYIQQPTPPGSPEAWKDHLAVATVVPGGDRPDSLNGVKFERWAGAKDWQTVGGQNPAVEDGLPPLGSDKSWKHHAAGVIIEEADGRIWLTRPTNGFGGYRHTFPKGTQEKGLTLQQTAIKEAWEETGLKIAITGVLGDFERSTSVARYYLAKRVGGDPRDMGWESQALRLSPRKSLKSLLNMHADFDITDTLNEEAELGKERPLPQETFLGSSLIALTAAMAGEHTPISIGPRTLALLQGMEKAKGAKTGHWQTQPRWPGGSPLGGQWKAYDGQGIIVPPSIGSAANPQFNKKAQALYGLAKGGDYALIGAYLADTHAKAVGYGFDPKGGTYGKPINSQQKWNLQLHQYASALANEKGPKEVHDAKVAGEAAIPTIASYKKIGGQGGSNPGGVFEGDGGKLYIKGSAAGGTDAEKGARARTEVLATKLAAAAGAGVAETHLVNLGKDFGGGIGVASKWVDGKQIDPASVQTLAARADFAVHAWLANWDSIGPDVANTKITAGGKAVCIDMGGSLFYRAQGATKAGFSPAHGVMPPIVGEWMSMRSGQANAGASMVYGGMTAGELKAAASKLLAMDDKTIKALVDAHGPGNGAVKATITKGLIARRDYILAQVGLKMDPKTPLQGQNAPLATPAPVEPKTAPAAPTGGDVGTSKPAGASNATESAAHHAISMVSAPTYKTALNGVMAGIAHMGASGDISGVPNMMNALHELGGKFGAPLGSNLGDAKAAVIDHMNAVAGKVAPPSEKDAPRAQAVSDPVDNPMPKKPVTADFKALGTGDMMAQMLVANATAMEKLHAAGDIAGLKTLAQAHADLADAAMFGGLQHNIQSKLADYGEALAAHLQTKAETAPTAPSGAGSAASTAKAAAEKAMEPIVGGYATKLLGGVMKDVGAAKVPTDVNLAMSSLDGTAFAPGSTAQKALDAVKAYAEAKHAELDAKWSAPKTPAPTATSDIPSAPTAPAFQGTAGAYYDGLVGTMKAAYAKGDMDGLKLAAVNKYDQNKPAWPINPTTGAPKSANAIKIADYHEKLVTALAPHSIGVKAAAVEAAIDMPKVANPPKPGTSNPPLPAMPDFNAKLIPASNTNATTHNGKVLKISEAASTGSVRDIVAMGFGVNTYGKQQAKLANEALAALGSPLTVTPGQKPNTHPSLTAGMKPDVAAAHMANAGKAMSPKALTPAPAKITPALADKDMPVITNFATGGANGGGLSSKAHINAANQEVQDTLLKLAKAGDYAGMQAATYKELNKDTGAPTGKVLPVSQHPSHHIQNFHQSALDTMREIMNPPTPLQIFEAKQAASSLHALTKQFPPKAMGTTVAKVKSNEKLGFWVALGQVKGHEGLVPKKQANFTPAASTQAVADFKKMSTGAKTFISMIQSSSAMNNAYRAGKDTYNGQNLHQLAVEAHKYARKQPAGTKIYRWQNTPPDMMKKLAQSTPGLIIQATGPMCTSKSPTATKGFGSHKIEIVYAEGAKAVNSFGSGAFHGEQEVSTLPNARFVLLSHTKEGGTTVTRLLMLPPDPALDGNAWGD